MTTSFKNKTYFTKIQIFAPHFNTEVKCQTLAHFSKNSPDKTKTFTHRQITARLIKLDLQNWRNPNYTVQCQIKKTRILIK